MELDATSRRRVTDETPRLTAEELNALLKALSNTPRYVFADPHVESAYRKVMTMLSVAVMERADT